MNMGEAFVPIVAAPILGASGVVGSVTPIPGDELSLIAYQLVDAGTSLGSALYDAGRFTGDFPNHYTLGIAGGEIIIVYWP